MLQRRLFWLRRVGALLGVVVFASGLVALFATDNSARSIFLVTFGVVLTLVAFLGERIQIESLEILGATIKVRDVVTSRLQLAERASSEPEDRGGAQMREQAHALQRLVGLYDLYVYIRKSEPFGRRRTDALDELAARMQQVGLEVSFDPTEVSTWFHDGDDALRVIAINLMLADERYRDFLAVLKTVDAPRSNFEQYYGLELASEMLPRLGWLEQRLLADAIGRAQHRKRFRRDDHLMQRSTTIMSELAAASGRDLDRGG